MGAASPSAVSRAGRALWRCSQSDLTDYFSNSQVVRKPVVATRGGVVAANHRRAAEVGAAILEAGGDAIDAAIATSFAIGVVEPWMSGIAACGCMTLWRAAEQKAYVIDYGGRPPPPPPSPPLPPTRGPPPPLLPRAPPQEHGQMHK